MKAMLSRPTTWLWLAAALVAGLLIHIVTVLAIAHGVPHRGMQILQQIPRINEMIVLPALGPDKQLLPYMAPDERYAFCRYDLSKGPVAIRAAFGDDYWSVVLFSPAGDNFYSLSSADLQMREVEILLAPTEEGGRAGSLPTFKESGESTITVSVPQRTGVAMLRAPVQVGGYEALTDRLLRQASCTLRPRAGLQAN